MACRKDGKGRVLRKGEGYRKGDGRYSYVYIDPLGKKRTIYAKSLVKLREREEQLQKDQLDGLDVYVAGKADVNFLFDRYISTKTELRSTTYSNYLYTWNHFIRDTFGKKKVRDVKYSDVLFFYTDLINNQGLQINTLETINTVLRPTFQLAVRDDIIRKNPVDGAYCEVKKRSGGARKTRRALTVDQQRKFMEYVAKNPFFYHWYPFFVFLLGTGCRIGELLGLTWDDVDFRKREISVNKTLVYIKDKETKKYVFKYQTPKTKNSIRTIPMQDSVYKALKRQWIQLKEMQLSASEWQPLEGFENLVFVGKNGKPITEHTFQVTLDWIEKSINKERKKQAEKNKTVFIPIPHFYPHALRHTFATRCFEAGIDAKVVQGFLGHYSIAITLDLYTHVTDDKAKSEMDKLQNLYKEII